MSRVLDTFLDLVRISSPTGHEREVALYAAEALAAVGCEMRYDNSQAQTGSDTGNLIGELPGTAPGPVIALSAHMDCIQPCEGVEPVVDGGIVRSAGPTVLGGDDKAGVAAIIETVRRLVESNSPHPCIRVLLTVAEEDGLVGAKALSATDAAADICLVLDADGSVGGIVTAAPTHYTFRALFTGRAAHAGVEPEKGISAIRMASAAIDRMPLGRLDESTTANIGTISGGSATNVVAPTCTVTGECRSHDRARAEEVRLALDAALVEGARLFDGQVEVTWELAYEGFSVSASAPSVQLVEATCRELGIVPRLFATGGGSDGNIISALGVETLVLSCGMTRVHTTDEEFAVAELERLVALLVAIARRAAG